MSKEEFYAASVEDAVEKAAVNLDVDRDRVVYRVLDSGSSGFLGIGARDARIEVDKNTGEAETQDEIAVEPVAVDEDSDKDCEESPGREESPAELGDKEVSTAEAPQELLDDVKAFVGGVTREMGLTARTDVYDAGEVIAVDVILEETGLFIGQKGETIDALQYLTNVASYKNREFTKKVVLDSEGYRQRRVEAIQGMAHRAARRAIREVRKIELSPMNSTERRVVHVYLKQNPDVTTYSEGRDDDRKVVVSPL